MNEAYRAQVRLMLDLLPLVAEEEAFALKGGTAINFFVRDMPRLSVDIDLTYLPLDDRAASLAGMSEGLTRIKSRAEDRLPGARVTLVPQGDDMEVKVHCQRGRARVKIEVNPLQRGSLWPVRQLACTDAVQETFESFVEMPVVSHADLFGGKVSAALDRQHPRDLFDVRHLLERQGYGPSRRCSVCPRGDRLERGACRVCLRTPCRPEPGVRGQVCSFGTGLGPTSPSSQRKSHRCRSSRSRARRRSSTPPTRSTFMERSPATRS